MLFIPCHLLHPLAPWVVLQWDLSHDFLMHGAKCDQSVVPHTLPFCLFLKVGTTSVFHQSSGTFPDHHNLSTELESNLTRTSSSSFSTLGCSLLGLYTFDWTGSGNTVLFYVETWAVWWCLPVGQINLGTPPQLCSYLLLIPELYLSQVIWILLLCATRMVWVHFPGFSFTTQGAVSLWKKSSMSFCSAVELLVGPNCGAWWCLPQSCNRTVSFRGQMIVLFFIILMAFRVSWISNN